MQVPPELLLVFSVNQLKHTLVHHVGLAGESGVFVLIHRLSSRGGGHRYTQTPDMRLCEWRWTC